MSTKEPGADPRLVGSFRDLASAHEDLAEYYRAALCFWHHAPGATAEIFLAAIREAAALDGVQLEEATDAAARR